MDELEVLRAIWEMSKPTIEALAKLYGPMQKQQPDTTVMYHVNYSDLHVAEVRNADIILAFAREKGLVPAEPEVVTVEIPDAKAKRRTRKAA